MSRNWVDDVFQEVSPNVETPHSFIWWSLVSAVAASAASNYFIVAFKGQKVYYPNLYVLLLGGSGVGKAHGINLAKLLVQKADVTRVIAGRSSVQAIVTDLSKKVSREDGKEPFKDSRAFIVNGELSSAIISDVQALAILTDLYDGDVNKDWNNSLKGTGTERLHNPCITALFGSSPAHFYDCIPQANIQGGYIGRNLIIYEEKRSKYIDPLGDDGVIDDKINNYIVPEYSKYLHSLQKYKGRMEISDSAKSLYNSWRRIWRENQDDLKDKTGFANRVPDHVLKVSICLSLARYDSNMSISEEDMTTAIEKVINTIGANKMATVGRGVDPLAEQSRLMIELLLRAPDHKLTRTQLLEHAHGNFDAQTLDRMSETFMDMKWLLKNRSGNDWVYILTGKPVEVYGRSK